MSTNIFGPDSSSYAFFISPAQPPCDLSKINRNSRAAGASDASLAAPSFTHAAPSVADSNYILIETTGPLDAQQKQALQGKAGVNPRVQGRGHISLRVQALLP